MNEQSVWGVLVMGLLGMLLLAPVIGCGDDDGGNGVDAGVDAAPMDAGVDATPDADPARYEPTELTFQMQMIENGAPGAVFAIVEGGEVTHAAAFGRKHPDFPEPMETTSLFRIASVTKMMTAVGLLQQVEAGTVSLDDPITDYLPGFAFTSDATATADITVRHLISHTSAIVDGLTHDAAPPYEDATALHDYTYEVFADSGYLMAPPGRMYNYTNPGFVLAGLITENVTGEPYAEYILSNVFGPLGMNRTFFSPADVLADGDFATGEVSTSYWATEIGSNRAEPDTYDNPWGWPAGFVFSSVMDLGRFVGFLRDGDPTVLAQSLLAEMQSPQVNTLRAVDTEHYGYGLFVYDGIFLGEAFYDLKLIRHSGLLGGFSSELFYLPHCDLGFVTLASTDGAYFSATLEVLIESLCDLPAPTTAPDLAADPADYPDYVGAYHEPIYFGDMIVTNDGTELRVEIPSMTVGTGYDPVLTPISKNNYNLHAFYDYPMTFIRSPGGQAEFLRGRMFVGSRLPAGAPPSPPPASLDPQLDLAKRYRPPQRTRFPLTVPSSMRRR